MPVQATYTEGQLQRMATHEFHSTIREVMYVLATIQCLPETMTAQIRGNWLLYLTDSQVAFYAIMGMKSKQKETLQLVFETWGLCRQHDIDLSVRWCSRREPHMHRADEQTRMVDNITWGMRPEAFEQVLADLGIAASDIQLDTFSQADMKKADRWFSLYNAPGSAG